MLATVPPFMNQMATAPEVVFRHRISALPSPLKSPTSAITQLVGMAGSSKKFVTVSPSMSHSSTAPEEVFRHRMSALPSPLKSPTLAIVQVGPAMPTLTPGVLVTVPPFMNQMDTAPEVVFRQRRSALPSPLKSPTWAMTQLVSTVPRPRLLRTVAPSSSHMATAPDVVFRHRRSLLPFWSKSRSTRPRIGAPIEISQMPRPCVAMRRTRDVFWIAMSNTATRGSPAPNGAQVVPPSVERYTPISVPAYSTLELLGSTTNALTGTSGMPLLDATQVGDALLRLVVFQIWLPRCPYSARVTYAVLRTVFGSM